MDKKRVRDLFWFDNETLRVAFWLLLFLASIVLIVALVMLSLALVAGAFIVGNWWQVPIALVILYGTALFGKLLPVIAVKAAGF